MGDWRALNVPEIERTLIWESESVNLKRAPPMVIGLYTLSTPATTTPTHFASNFQCHSFYTHTSTPRGAFFRIHYKATHTHTSKYILPMWMYAVWRKGAKPTHQHHVRGSHRAYICVLCDTTGLRLVNVLELRGTRGTGVIETWLGSNWPRCG